MPVLEACCCCDLLTGSIVAGVYTIVVYCVAFGLSVWWLLDETMYRSEHASSSGRVPGYVLCGGHLALVLASLCLLYGLYRRMARVVLCWVLLMVLVFFPEMGLVLFVNLYYRTVVTPSGMLDLALYTVRAAVNVVCILCVHSLYTTWRRSHKQDLPSSHHLSGMTQNQLSLPKDALEDESLYNGSLYNGHSVAYPASLYSQPTYVGYNGCNGYDNRSFSGYDNRSLSGYEGRYGYAGNGCDGRFENGSANSAIAASKELVPSKVSSTASQLECRALPRASSRLSLRQNSVYGSQQLVPAQFNAALYASATSLTNIGPYYMRSLQQQQQRQLLSPGGVHAAAYLQHMVHYLPQDYATQSLDRRGVRRDEDCDNLSLRGVGLRGARQGFILTPRGRGRGRGRGSLTSLGAESDELGRYRDVAL